MARHRIRDIREEATRYVHVMRWWLLLLRRRRWWPRLHVPVAGAAATARAWRVATVLLLLLHAVLLRTWPLYALVTGERVEPLVVMRISIEKGMVDF